MYSLNKRFFVIILLLVTLNSYSQHFTHDFGFHSGMVAVQTDYGVRDNFLSSYGNVSASFSFTHTLHFFNRNQRWNADHKLWSYLALRTELNFIPNVNKRHHGIFVEQDNQLGRELQAMTGKLSIVNIGFQFEYYLKCLRDFVHPFSDIKWNPYVLAGVQYTMFDNELNSTLGDWTQDPTVLPDKWRPEDATDVGPGTTYALTFGGGMRYNLTRKIDLNAQFNWQFFLSDSVDGLTANVSENRNNEWLINFQLGIIFHLNFSKPLSLF